jgi:hypothetical protein
MKLLFSTLLAIGGLWSGVTVAQARIGETEKQCEERYGKPGETHQDKSMQLYAKGDLVVLAHFYEGKCDYILYRKAERDQQGKAKELSENERDLLLKANAGSRVWVAAGSKGTAVAFLTEDEEFQAQYDLYGHTLSVSTRDAVKRKQDEKKAEEEKKLKGF